MSEPQMTALIVEDETDIRELLALHIKRQGLQITECSNSEDALKLISEQSFNLFILDWMLPGMSGVDLARHLRSNENTLETPILMVTARAEPQDIVAGLEAGADDYITKPFEPAVLAARVQALIRRAKKTASSAAPSSTAQEATQLKLGTIRVDLAAHQVFLQESEVHLTPSEFKLLVALLQNKGRVLTRNRLIQLVQGEGIAVVDRVVDTLVFGLRKKLGDQAELIETVRGVGYRVQGEGTT